MASTLMKPAAEENPWGAFSAKQGETYAQNRRSYAPSLYESILKFHKSTGGHLDSLVDIGCGPGVAVRDLAQHFNTAVGLDSSQGMVDTARSLGSSKSAASTPIRFELSAAEEIGSNLPGQARIPDGSVDLIIAANSAHYFDMSRFWAAAARVLRSSGSVALWASTPVGMHPSVPNAAAIEQALLKIRQEEMAPYEKFKATKSRETASGNRTPTAADSATYRDLLLPWHDKVRNPEFDEARIYQQQWTGSNNQGRGDADEFFAGQPRVDLDTMEEIMGITAGPYLDWRKSHPDLAGTKMDMLRRSRREIERLQREAGIEPGKEWVKSNVEGFLLIVKKKP